MRAVDLSVFRNNHKFYSHANIAKCEKMYTNTNRKTSRTSSTTSNNIGSSYSDKLKNIRENYLNQYYTKYGTTPYSNLNSKLNSSIYTENTKPANVSSTNSNNIKYNEGNIIVKTDSGKKVLLGYKDGQFSIIDKNQIISDNERTEISNIEKAIAYLGNDSTGAHAKAAFSPEKLKKLLGQAGIKPGFIEINSGKGNRKYCLLDNGNIYSEAQVEGEREFYNSTDLIKYEGYTKDSYCMIDGKRYNIDKNGHFNIPAGVRCVSENMKIVK